MREPGQECLGVTREQMTFSDCLWDLQGKARARSNGGGKSNQRSDQRSDQRSRDAPTAFPGLGHPCPTFTFMSTVLHHLRITDPGQLGKSVRLSFPLLNCSPKNLQEITLAQSCSNSSPGQLCPSCDVCGSPAGKLGQEAPAWCGTQNGRGRACSGRRAVDIGVWLGKLPA